MDQRKGPSSDDVFIVVPAFNESRTIGVVIRELRAVYLDVVVVDDGSTDKTTEIAREAGARVLRHCLNRGQGAALQTGIRHCLELGAHFVVTFDADGQHSVDDIEQLLEPLFSGQAKIALGSRFLGSAKGMPAFRRLLLKAAVLFTRLTARIQVTDTHNGLRALSRPAAERLEITVDRMGHASEIADWIGSSGLSFTEVPVHIRYTDYSRAKGQGLLAVGPILVDYLLRRFRR